MLNIHRLHLSPVEGERNESEYAGSDSQVGHKVVDDAVLSAQNPSPEKTEELSRIRI